MKTSNSPDIRTSICLSIYTFIGFGMHLFLPQLEDFCLYSLTSQSTTLITYILIALLAAIVTYFFRLKLIKIKGVLGDDSSYFTKSDWMAFLHGFCLFLIGMIALILDNINVRLDYFVMFTFFCLSIGLNTYLSPFLSFELLKNESKSVDSLKLKHAELSILFNNLCIASFVFVGGAMFGLFPKFQGTISINSKLTSLVFASTLIFCAFLTPVLWLLRPIHKTMTRIRVLVEKVDGG
jgi:hypothetical protein